MIQPWIIQHGNKDTRSPVFLWEFVVLVLLPLPRRSSPILPLYHSNSLRSFLCLRSLSGSCHKPQLLLLPVSSAFKRQEETLPGVSWKNQDLHNQKQFCFNRKLTELNKSEDRKLCKNYFVYCVFCLLVKWLKQFHHIRLACCFKKVLKVCSRPLIALL